MALALTDYWDVRGITWKDSIVMVAADATNSNTGCHKGAMTHLQSMARRTLQFNVCLIHENELPLRHLFEELKITTI